MQDKVEFKCQMEVIEVSNFKKMELGYKSKKCSMIFNKKLLVLNLWIEKTDYHSRDNSTKRYIY
jgi:hypothetical protein